MNRHRTPALPIIYLIIISLTLALSVTLIIMTAVFGAKITGVQNYVSTHKCTPASSDTLTPETQEVIAPAKRLYVLGAKDGKLAIYEADGLTLVNTLDTYVYSLPLADREAVNEGIPVYSVNELVSLIEDYTS